MVTDACWALSYISKQEELVPLLLRARPDRAIALLAAAPESGARVGISRAEARRPPR